MNFDPPLQWTIAKSTVNDIHVDSDVVVVLARKGEVFVSLIDKHHPVIEQTVVVDIRPSEPVEVISRVLNLIQVLNLPRGAIGHRVLN